MNVKATTVGFVMAGLVSAGAVTVLVVSQPAPVKTVRFVAPVDSTPTATVTPTVVPTTEAPAPVESTTAPAPVAAPKEAPVATKAPAPAPKPAIVAGDPYAGAPAPGDGPQPIVKDANGNLVPPPVIPGTGPEIDGHGVNIPIPTP